MMGLKPLTSPFGRIAVLGVLLFAWMIHPSTGFAQSAATPSQASAEPRSSDDPLPPRMPAAGFSDTLVFIQQRAYARAEESLRAEILSHPGSGEAHFLLGYTLYREDKADASLAEYTAGARLQKPNANDLAVVAMDYILLHDYGDADKWLTLATSWSPKNEPYWYYLGRTKYAENRFQEAIDVFGKCLTLAPRDVRAEYNMGLAYAGLGRDDAAAADYRTAIAWEEQADGRDPQPYLDLGVLLLQQGKPDEALPNLEKAVALDAQNPRAREQLGQAYEQLHNLAKADEEMHAAVALAPNIPSLHFEMGRIYQKEGLSEQAKAEFARCAALNASHSTDAEETPNPAPHE